MPAPSFLATVPRPVLFSVYGGLAALLVALTFGELVWWLFAPPPAPEVAPHTVPPVVKPAAKLALTVSPKVSIYPGGTNAVGVRVARERFEGPVSITFEPSGGLSAADVLLAAGEDSGTTQLLAIPAAKPGTYKFAAIATGTAPNGQLVLARATVEVTVLPVPPPPPRLAVTVSQRVQAYQRGTNTFAVRIARGEFDDEVTVTFDKPPEGVSVAPITIPAGATEATGELTVEGGAPAGAKMITATARAKPKGVAISADWTATVDVLPSPKVPVDVVFALDCTGSMRKTVDGVSDAAEKFAAELRKANLDARFGLVGFQDTTLGQPLKVPKLDGDRMSPRPSMLRAAMQNIRLGGGGGEGESSLDGIAEAADFPLREKAVRAIVLVTDGDPKRVDGRMKSIDETVKHLKAKKIDQLHVAALPEHKKQFEPLWAGAKGKYFDLKAASEGNAFERLMTDVAKAISDAVPEQPVGKVEAGRPAPEPVLPAVGAVRPLALPAGAEPEEPKVEPPAEAPKPPPAAVTEPPEDDVRGKKALAFVVWALVVVMLSSGALLAGQVTFLPGESPAQGARLAGYGIGTAAGLLAGAAAYGAFDLAGIPLLARGAGAVVFGLTLGALVGLAERFFRDAGEGDDRDEPEDAPRKKREPREEPLSLDDEEPTAPKVASKAKGRDGCPGCGRVIPGPTGERYCMLCDKTF